LQNLIRKFAMKRVVLLIIAFLIAVTNCPAQNTSAKKASARKAQPTSKKVTTSPKVILNPTQIYNRLIESTVTVSTETGHGSGFFVAPNVVATNYHVIEGENEVICYDPSGKISYHVTGYLAVDKVADLILLKVEGSKSPKPIAMASGDVATGQVVYALGTPKSWMGTISDGIVSARRNINNIAYIQITAPISPGSSGGPVVNRLGYIIGVSVGGDEDGQNLNFAIDYHHLADLMRRQSSYPLSLASLNRPNTGTNQPNTGKRNSASYEHFSRSYRYVAFYYPEDLEWSEKKRTDVNVEFNINRSNGVRIIYESGRTETFKILSGITEDYSADGSKYQMSEVLDENGDELLLLFSDEDDALLIIYASGFRIQFSNS